MDTTIATITGENFACPVHLTRDDTGQEHVWFVADADIDADGANGQHGQQAAYVIGNKGSELLANGGLSANGKIVKAWARDIFILDHENQPKVFPGGILASTTWYRHRDRPMDDPAAYLDSETENYIVVPPLIITHTRGVVRGCKARVTYQGRSAWAVVGDKGPRDKVGEMSIALARALGIPHSPRTGGTDKPEVLYDLWPGVPAPGYELQPE